MCKEIQTAIAQGKTALGIEFGSTRIKAVLIDETKAPIASGSHDWENQLVDGIWTYSLDMIWEGVRDAYAKLAADVLAKYDVKLTKIGAIGFSAMMHGYMAFNDQKELMVPFRTWRNAITERSAAELSELFQFNVPQRWTIAHLYQAILNGEAHVPSIAHVTTLAVYIHWMLTGEKVAGVGEASGIFPIDMTTKTYNAKMVAQFEEKIADKGYTWKLLDVLPKVLVAGENAGVLTEEGAKLLDPTGTLEAGIPLCPPEGDAGTGMVATNSVRQRTGNISAGTSIFGMVVLEKPLSKFYPEIDVVTTPSGDDVAMVHCNNCTSDLNAWVNLFKGFCEEYGLEVTMPKVYDALYFAALKGDPDCGGLLAYNYISGENITGFDEGRPLFVRTPDSKFTFQNFARTTILTALAALKIGLDILIEEGVKMDKMLGHGGLYKTPVVGQKLTAAAINAPVSVMKTAGEGGPWGMALLADYMLNKEDGEELPDYLDNKVFGADAGTGIDPDPADVEGFNNFIVRYKAGLPIERAALDSLK